MSHGVSKDLWKSPSIPPFLKPSLWRLRRLLFNFDGIHARVVDVGDEGNN
jgi:hypothetical protein